VVDGAVGAVVADFYVAGLAAEPVHLTILATRRSVTDLIQLLDHTIHFLHHMPLFTHEFRFVYDYFIHYG